jgi:hypothetical protein
MSAIPPESFVPAAAARLPAGQPRLPAVTAPPRDGAAVAARWGAILEAASVVAALAGRGPEAPDPLVRGFPVAIAQAGGQRLIVARQAMEDLSVILETGIRALLSVHARGASPLAAAEALWAEFRGARDALVALAPPERRLLG